MRSPRCLGSLARPPACASCATPSPSTAWGEQRAQLWYPAVHCLCCPRPAPAAPTPPGLLPGARAPAVAPVPAPRFNLRFNSRSCPRPRRTPCSYGFVRYASIGEAQAAIAALDGTSVLGHTLQVKFADADAGARGRLARRDRVGRCVYRSAVELWYHAPVGIRHRQQQQMQPRHAGMPAARGGLPDCAQSIMSCRGRQPSCRRPAGPPTIPAPSGLTPSDSCYVKHLPASYGVSLTRQGGGCVGLPETSDLSRLHRSNESLFGAVHFQQWQVTNQVTLAASHYRCRCKRCSSCLRRTEL